jgi:UDP-N-acetylmuramoyl-L-alanyl-D-glutamate--2,6-diaminopimelate ligase
MLLTTILKDWADIPETLAAFNVEKLVSDSRQIGEGDCFVAIPGLTHDGSAYAKIAAEKGASLLIIDDQSEMAQSEVVASHKAHIVCVSNLALKAGLLFSRFYEHPSRQLKVIGVTGTNGKTSVALMLAQLLERLGKSSAVIGTLGAGDWSDLKEAQTSGLHTHTTPDAPQLQKLLHEFEQAKKEYVIMEVSSHGLSQGRLSGTKFSAVIFTNLSRDHLDYHGTMEAYAEAKAQLFQWPELETSMINNDDAVGATISSVATKALTYSLNGPSDYQLTELSLNESGLDGLLIHGGEKYVLAAGLLGRFNAYNILACVGVLHAQGFTLADILSATITIQSPLGRMQLLDASVPVVIDFAHTPDALAQVLIALKHHCSGKLHVVFGCGGDRDIGKRAEMGAIAGKHADVIWVTSDNPRSENPETILSHIQAGISKEQQHNVQIQVDRKEAIFKAITQLQTGDWLVIAGKGHEDYQEIKGVKHPFSDISIAQEALSI